jgi:Fe-S-cluster containining protein
VLDSYVKDKLALYTKFSHFACTSECPRYGCRSDLTVSASLLEIHVQSRFLRRSVRSLFDFAYKLSPSIDQGMARARIRFVLRKPCVFLKNGKMCGIYEMRTAVCALFPEHLGLMDDEARRVYVEANRIESYLCVSNLGAVSDERKEALQKLLGLHQKEILATELYLFERAGFTVDLREDAAAVTKEVGEIPFVNIERLSDCS